MGYMETSAYYAPANAIVKMIEAILSDSKTIFPCAVFLDGQYGYTNTVNGVPVVLDANGVEKILELPLNLDEQQQFGKSVESVEVLLDILRKKNFFTS